MNMKVQDPIDSFFAALWSGPLRAIVGLAGVCLALMACAAASGGLDASPKSFFAFVTMLPFMFLAWCEFDSLAVLGVVSGVAMWGSLYAFVRTDSGKGWFFAILTSGLVYFGPLALDGKWQILLASYAVFALAYWVVPLAIRKRRHSGE